LEHQPFLSVQAYTKEWPGPDGAGCVVGLHEVAGHDFPELLEGTVVLLLDRPDVEDALNEDAEVIHLWGEALDLGILEAELRRWWVEHLRQYIEAVNPTS
jgi:hypothetical protein